MNERSSRVLACRGLVKGRAEGPALVARTTLSFWGEVDPVSGRVISKGHPLEGADLGGRILIIESTRGSSATPLVMGLAHQFGHAPAAVINTHVDSLAVLGCVVNQIPMVTDLAEDPFALIETDDHVVVDATVGQIRIRPRDR